MNGFTHEDYTPRQILDAINACSPTSEIAWDARPSNGARVLLNNRPGTEFAHVVWIEQGRVRVISGDYGYSYDLDTVLAHVFRTVLVFEDHAEVYPTEGAAVAAVVGAVKRGETVAPRWRRENCVVGTWPT